MNEKEMVDVDVLNIKHVALHFMLKHVVQKLRVCPLFLHCGVVFWFLPSLDNVMLFIWRIKDFLLDNRYRSY